MFEEKILKCRECGCEFVFSASEQEYFAEKEFADPGRCLQCRQVRKQNNLNAFRPGSRPQQREMHSATCSGCGVKTQVPFRPSYDRPVYCKDCLSRKHNINNRRNSFLFR
ncbi:MAG: CxxC-x17-CxxC domain-containing protein [Thermacetogeniaceae bacterium]